MDTFPVLQTDYGAYPASYPMCIEGKADQSPRASAEVKKMWIYTSTPLYAFMA
jgi:hypothetical protein